jgi:1,4-alpha-glucan branching enzyme
VPIASQKTGMGANLYQGGCSFRVWAPNAKDVYVTGRFCDWDPRKHALVHEGGGYWSADVPAVTVGDPYKFVIVNGPDIWRVDAYARDVDDEGDQVHGIVVDPRTHWAPFATPRFDDLILYQMHLGSFAGLNDGISVDGETASFQQIESKLDYVRGLGFNALALLPLGEFPMRSGLGYAPTNWFAPETAYGSPADLRRLVDLAHRKGLAVIFDVVYNHASTIENRYWEYDGDDRDGGIYFRDGGDSPWGRIPAHWQQEVRNFFLDNARMWLDEYRGDGLRFDAAHYIPWDSVRHIIEGLRANPFWRDKFLVAEWNGDRRDQWPSVIRELGFNAVWGMSGPWAFRAAMTGERPVEQIESVMSLAEYQNHWNVVRYFLGSHDQIADGKNGEEGDHRFPVEKLGGRQSWVARAQSRVGWALNVAAPGVPMLFMGCEGHHHGYWWPTRDANPEHQDHRLDWSIMGDAHGAPMQALVRAANRVRWEHPALRSHSLDITHRDHDNGVLAFRRWNDQGDVVLVVANLGGRQWQSRDYGVVTGAGGRWEEIFNSQAPAFGGFEDSGNFGAQPEAQADGRIYINLPPWSVLMFRRV